MSLPDSQLPLVPPPPSDQHGYDRLAQALKTPQTRGMLFVALGIVAAIAVIWLVLLAILSLLNIWIVILTTLVLGGIVFFREYQNRRRQLRIDLGFCAQCGYDLDGEPAICPQCSRDARLDEPVWRKLRREQAAKKLAEPTPFHEVILDQTITPAQPPKPKIRTIIKTPDFHEGPIPLEGD